MLARVSRKRFGQLLILLTLTFCLSMGARNGCSSFENVAGGTGLGAALGAGIGALAGDPALGAAIGAGAGFVGGMIYDNMSNNTGGALTETEMREARLQALEMEGQYDPNLYALRIDRDANDNIRVVPYLKPQSTNRLQLIQ
jgi:hypothetical protein